MYINNSVIFHIVDETTRYQPIKYVQNVTAKYTWDSLRLCWINGYLGPPHYIYHDVGKKFVDREFS